MKRKVSVKDTKKVLVFSDEKNFYLDAYMNRRNARYIAGRPEDVGDEVKFSARSKYPSKAMMLGVVCANGLKLPPVWVEGNLDSTQYQKILSDIVFPALEARLGAGCWVWTQ